MTRRSRLPLALAVAAASLAGCRGQVVATGPVWLLDPVQYGQLWYRCHPEQLHEKIERCAYVRNAGTDYGCLLATNATMTEIPARTARSTSRPASAPSVVDPLGLQCRDYAAGPPPPSYDQVPNRPALPYQPPYPNLPEAVSRMATNAAPASLPP